MGNLYQCDCNCNDLILFIRNAMLYDGDFLGMRSLTEASEMYAREDIKPSNRPTPMNLGMGLGEMLNTTQYMGKHGPMQHSRVLWQSLDTWMYMHRTGCTMYIK